MRPATAWQASGRAAPRSTDQSIARAAFAQQFAAYVQGHVGNHFIIAAAGKLGLLKTGLSKTQEVLLGRTGYRIRKCPPHLSAMPTSAPRWMMSASASSLDSS